MRTTENQGYFRLLTRLINRFFFRGQWKKDRHGSIKTSFKSFNKDLNVSNVAFHGDEEAFWFI